MGIRRRGADHDPRRLHEAHLTDRFVIDRTYDETRLAPVLFSGALQDVDYEVGWIGYKPARTGNGGDGWRSQIRFQYAHERASNIPGGACSRASR
jgi:hypothetical protein